MQAQLAGRRVATDLTGQDRAVTAAQRGEGLVIADDGAGMAAREFRRLFGASETGDDHGYRALLREFERGDKSGYVAYRFEQDRNHPRRPASQQVIHVIADAGVGFLAAGNNVIETETQVIVGEVSHARSRVQNQADVPCRPAGRRPVETDHHLVVVIVKTHRVAAADRDTGVGGLAAQAFGQARFAVAIDVIGGINQDTAYPERDRLVETFLQCEAADRVNHQVGDFRQPAERRVTGITEQFRILRIDRQKAAAEAAFDELAMGDRGEASVALRGTDDSDGLR